jgi:ABC-type bacteriocin/lantibiotic exporter with double-glycine peptidase domain
MQPRTCNSTVWILVVLAVVLLMFQGGMGLLAIVLPVSLLLACATLWSGNHKTKLTQPAEKR